MCIYIIKLRPLQVINELRKHSISDVGISTITLSELEYGIRKSSRPDKNKLALIKFLTPIEIISFDDQAAREYGEIRAYLENQGTPIGSLDMFVAAHSKALDCTLVTNNEREFTGVPGLKLVNWVKT